MTQGFAVTTLDELGQRLKVLAAGFSARDDRQAYFAALYGLMTGRVADGVAAGRFTDGVRMERLACHFASRYLSALDAFGREAEAPASWTLARDRRRAGGRSSSST